MLCALLPTKFQIIGIGIGFYLNFQFQNDFPEEANNGEHELLVEVNCLFFAMAILKATFSLFKAILNNKHVPA